MASYFSNHSHSRFLANTAAAQPQANQASPSSKPGARSSKHFSTSVSASGDEGPTVKEGTPLPVPVNGVGVHPLRNTWIFWFRQQRAPGNKITNYEEGIKKISAFSSVESFWSLWTHLNPPSGLLPTTDYLLFHSGIRRPVWEDPLNLTGGKWIIRLKKGVADRIWEEIILAIIGDQFREPKPLEPSAETAENLSDDSDSSWGGDSPEICGCTISVRQNEDILSVWNRSGEDVKSKEMIRDTLRRVLHLSSGTIMEYKSNNDSMQDKSSFRNSAVDRTSLA